ncbi:MAG: indolepyruvate ferredoxin oxidoreductase subunit alpha [Candidatus Lokiarchaeota archaeon]|nr:indolepyruvate ferredoxin oxidoreductase subunit alpha [Candidatus Lokiarchaeota archaeon]
MSYNKIVKGKPGDEKFYLGNEAIVRGALESGIDVYTYYPGTPSSEVGETFMEIYKEVGMKWVESSINEKVAMEVAGAAYARGAAAMVGMKNVGLNVASDPLFALATTRPKNKNSAMVILVADDPQQHSSAVEMDSRYFLKIFKIPALEPSNPQECLEFTKEAFKISRELKLPVIIRTVTMVSHARSNVVIGDIKPSGIEVEFDLSKEVNVALRLYFLELKEEHIYNRLKRALEMSENISLNKIVNENAENQFDLGIITSGVSYSYVCEALDFLELEAPILKIGFINPLPERKIVEFLKRFKQIFIIEENDTFLETQILAIAQKNMLNVKIHGKDPFSYSKENTLLPMVGELNTTKIALALSRIANLEIRIDLKQINKKMYNTLTRRPILCAGCPHRTTGYALQKAVKKINSNTGKIIYFFQDIGCYTLLALTPFSFANVKYCMGSSIAIAQGVAQTSESLNIAIIGDGTFFHSGIPALLNGIYNKTPILVLILDNGWIGMTGQQPNPGSDTRYYKEGNTKKAINLEDFLRGTGVYVNVINHYENNDEKYFTQLRQLIYEKGLDVIKNKNLHVIVIKDECIQKSIKRQVPTIRIIDSELCNNCGICFSKFLCPAIDSREENAYIDPNLCLGCGICEEICPNNAIKTEEL